MNEKHVKALKNVSLENVSVKYEFNDGTSFWCVYDEKTGDFDPGYKTEEDAIAADERYNGKSERTEDRKIDV